MGSDDNHFDGRPDPETRRVAPTKRLESWAKTIGLAAGAASIILGAATYFSESDIRRFEQTQRAWDVLNDHAKNMGCVDERGQLGYPSYHTNSGHISALEFLISQGASLNGIGLPCSEFGDLRATGARLNNAKFHKSNFAMADFTQARLKLADMSYSQINGAYFTDADLTSANLTGSSLLWTHLEGATLAHAVFHGADLSKSNFSGATIDGVDLAKTNVSGAIFTGVKGRPKSTEHACYFPSSAAHPHPEGMPVGWPDLWGPLEDCSRQSWRIRPGPMNEDNSKMANNQQNDVSWQNEGILATGTGVML